MNRECSIYRNTTDTTGRIVTLAAVIKRIRDGARRLDEKTRHCNALAATAPKKYKRYKEKNLPAVTFSGIFPKGQREAAKLLQHSGQVTLDIDGLNPNDIPDLLAELAQMPQVLLAFVSPSGLGIKVIVRVDPIPTDATEHKGAYAACLEFFDDLAFEFGFEIDTSGSDCSRLCFLAHDPLAIVNENAKPITWDRDAYLAENARQAKQRQQKISVYDNLPIDATALDFIKPDTDTLPDKTNYDTWLLIGIACYRAGVPFQVWDAWSARGAKYNASEMHAKWNSFARQYDGEKVSWGTVVYLAKENGYVPKRTQRRSSLKITADSHETFVTLAENEQAILDAFTQALTKETDALLPHYHILHFEMGSGKNHAFLTTLATLKKRGMGIFENHEQVDEQVSKAFKEFGLRAMGFKGRGYKFDESGITALPVNLRQQDSDLFDKYKVMCGFYDQILKRQSKGLGAYEYCLDCPFLKTCPYLAQFQIAAEMDFLAVCLHDLFFDPGFAAVLGRLWRRGEETEEEQIIGDALGVETQTQMEFDIGVIDEVVAHNLYLSYEYTFADFEALSHAWEGEALGAFFTEVLRCLRSDDTDPFSAVKAYLQTIDDDTRLVINQQMTQIPKAVSVHEHTQRHTDTHEVLSQYYVVDNTENQWRIPVSKDAEQILRKKKVPTLAYQKHLPKSKIGVSPYAELRNGQLMVSEIQGRLWSKDWTLLEQLLKAIKLDIQWIGTKYNTKGEPVCCDTLTLTIPPQVNPIVKRLVLMGGTLDVENLKQAFLGQPVKITVEEGKTAEYARGVETYQFTDGRVTHQSVFEYETDAEGKTIYDEQTNAPVVIGIKPTALTFLAHLCRLAERHIAEGNHPPVFISYKDFTEPPIADLPIGRRMHNCLQVKHFDLTRGLNFEGVKPFITYGYPKSARPDVVKQTAETLHHADEKPLDFTYERVNETTDGYQAENIGQYKDPRVEAVRQQLTRDKSKQALFRARPTRWEGTLTLNVSAEPIPGWTERATGFTRPDFYRAESFEELGARIAERTALNAENTIEDFQRVYDCGREKARLLWHEAGGKEHKNDEDAELLRRLLEMKAQNIGERKIAEQLGISYGKLRSLLKNNEVH